MLVLDLQYLERVNCEKICTFISKRDELNISRCLSTICVYFSFFSGECTAPFRFNGIHSSEGLNRPEKMGR